MVVVVGAHVDDDLVVVDVEVVAVVEGVAVVVEENVEVRGTSP